MATDWYAEITNTIIASLESADPADWKKPWQNMGKMGAPHNGASGHEYRGINILLLGFAGYSDSRWYSYKQAAALGGQVRKGEKGRKIVFWKFLENTVEGVVKKIPLLRVYTVFNAHQIDGLPEEEKAPEVDIKAQHEKAFQLIQALNPKVVYDGARAAYSKTTDQIMMPDPGQFLSPVHYYATLFHECGHWTGHESRLDRQLGNRFGSEAYAMEELIAEITAAFLCAKTGIEGDLQHPEYVKSWLKVLKGDKMAVFAAARDAQKAADFILSAGKIKEEIVEEDKGEE